VQQISRPAILRDTLLDDKLNSRWCQEYLNIHAKLLVKDHHHAGPLADYTLYCFLKGTLTTKRCLSQ
jgi:hypothetical protein